jgi:hypothetical protein
MSTDHTPAPVPTPRSTAVMFYQPSDHYTEEVVPCAFARALERELTALTRENEALRENAGNTIDYWKDQWAAQTKRYDEASEQVAKLTTERDEARRELAMVIRDHNKDIGAVRDRDASAAP